MTDLSARKNQMQSRKLQVNPLYLIAKAIYSHDTIDNLL
jgi:hypothetical protein